MKQEDKYIDYLFESARKEEPQLSYEEVAEVFSASTSPTLLGLAKGWFLKNINLNSLLFITAGGLGFITFSFLSESKTPTAGNIIVTNQIQESSSSKGLEFTTNKELSDRLFPEFSNIETTKNIKPISVLAKSKNRNNNTFTSSTFDKKMITESPKISSIIPEIKLEESINLSPALSQKYFKKEKTIPGYQPQYKTVEETFDPWVSGSPSEMPWKIKRQKKIPILNQTERVLQQFMNTRYLEQVFEKEENGYFKPLNMLVHHTINENNFVQFKGKRVRLLSEEIAPDFDPSQPFIDVKRFKINKNKAHFTFVYKDFHVQMQLRRVGEGWKRNKLKVKQNKKVKVNMTF